MNGLLACAQHLDDDLHRGLFGFFEQTFHHDDGILAGIRPALEAFEPAGPVPVRYARHAGVAPCLPASWGPWEVSTQAEIAASLAWAEFTRRNGRHQVQAAKAAHERHNLLRQCLLPAVRQRLEAAQWHESFLLLTLAWLGLHDLDHAVKW